MQDVSGGTLQSCENHRVTVPRGLFHVEQRGEALAVKDVPRGTQRSERGRGDLNEASCDGVPRGTFHAAIPSAILQNLT
jgi:hypothetical protein